MLNNMNQIFSPPQDDDIIDQLYPNPDNMTYEQLLELEEKMGYVNKGLTYDQINVKFIFFISKRKFLASHSIEIETWIVNVQYVNMNIKKGRD